MKQTNASPKHSSWVYYLGTLAMLASMLLLPHLIPSWADGITPAGVSIACVFVGAIIGILTTNDLILCALFAMGGLVINGIQTPAQVISSFMGASYVWQIVVLYALCYVIIRDNTGEVIARFLLTRRFTQKYPMVMVMMLLFAFGLAAAGVQVVTFRFVAEAFAILIAFCAVFALALRFLFRCDIRALGRVDLAQALADKPLRLTRRQWIPLAAFLIIALHSFTSPYWPEMPVLSALKEMDTVLFTSVALAVLALIRVDGEQIFCPVEAFTKGVSWPIVMAVASMAAIGGLLVADEYGIKAWLTQALGGLFSNHSPLLFVAMTVLITLLLTNFFSNTATLLVVSSLVSALSGPLVDAGYDITILAVAISLSSMVAYLTYASSGQAAILLSQKNMDNKFIWTYGIAAMLLYAAVVILVSAVCLFF